MILLLQRHLLLFLGFSPMSFSLIQGPESPVAPIAVPRIQSLPCRAIQDFRRSHFASRQGASLPPRTLPSNCFSPLCLLRLPSACLSSLILLSLPNAISPHLHILGACLARYFGLNLTGYCESTKGCALLLNRCKPLNPNQTPNSQQPLKP
jgi:hypothetical protein